MCRLGNLDNISWIVHRLRHHSVEEVLLLEMLERRKRRERADGGNVKRCEKGGGRRNGTSGKELA